MTDVAAVDLGAQSGRVAVGRFDGESLAVDTVHRFSNRPVAAEGSLYWDSLALFAEVCEGLRLAGAGARISTVGVDSWGVDFGLIDASGRLLRNPVHYRDERRARAYSGVLQRIGGQKIYGRTGVQLMPINTLYELAAMADESDPALGYAKQLLLIPDLMHFWLSGSRTSELTNASTTQCFAADGQEWDTELLEQLGVPVGLMPDVASPGSTLGRLLPRVVASTGLVDAVVVAGATHDTAAAVAGTPLRDERSAYLSCGTWSLVGIETIAPITTEAAFRANLTNERGLGGTVRVLRNVTGLWLLHECRKAWANGGRHYHWSDLIRLASSGPELSSFIDPNDERFGAPGEMPMRIADYCRETGQAVPESDDAVVRCVLESLALKHAETLDLLARVSGRTIDQVHVVGGGSNNELLCKWTAEASGREVVAGPEEATVVGNIIAQLIGVGELDSLAQGRELIARSFVFARHGPTEDSRWREARERFAALSPTNCEEVTV